MFTKSIRKWLSEFKTIQKEVYSEYASQVQQNEQLIDELFEVFDDDLSPEVIDPVCHQLFDFYRSLDVGLKRFTLEFVPLLFRTYLFAVEGENINDKKKYGGIEACLLGIYNIEAASQDQQTKAKKVTIPSLARPSIYHEPPSLTSVVLTENVLMNYYADKELSISAGSKPQVDSINSQNRLPILTYVMNRYNAHIAFMSPRSHKMVCKLGSKLSKSGFDSLDGRNSAFMSSNGSHRGVTIAEDLRIPLSSNYLLELLYAVYYTMFNGYVRIGLQALEDIHFRASYELYPDVLMVANAIRNSLQLNPSGQPKDGPMGISIMLSPAQGNPVFAKDAITNASFRAKKLPEDIDVQDESGPLETSFHDDGSDGDPVLLVRTSESSEKSKSSPLPKSVKGPLKSIMKKKEDKAKDRIHRKESDIMAASLTTGVGRKGSHFKELLDLHAAKSPKHSVSVSTGLSVSVNGESGPDANSIPVNVVRSSSSNRSVFEMVEGLTTKDTGRASSLASSVESGSATQEDATRGHWNNTGAKLLLQQPSHSRATNGAPVAKEEIDNVSDKEDEGHVYTKL